MTYKHGVYTYEEATALVPPSNVDAAIPLVFGTAPVHQISSGTGPVNVPTLCSTYAEAVAVFGYSDDWDDYTLCEFFKAFFALYSVAPMIVVNVFDPETHMDSVTDEEKTFAGGELTLAHDDIIAVSSVNSAASQGGTAYTEGTDYDINRKTGVMTVLDGGSLTDTSTVFVCYDYATPETVATSDIEGGIDGNGVATGLELVDSVFPMTRLVPGVIVAPGWSATPAVASLMAAKAGNINDHFQAICIVDIPDATVTKYSDVPAYKTTNNLTDPLMTVCWPKIKNGDDTYHMSSQLAGLIAQVDADNEDVPYVSPSNHGFQMTAAVANNAEVWLGPTEANYLNGQGIITALNFVGGWKCWGNRTGAYPDVTDVKDAFLPIRRMLNWIANTITLSIWQKVDGAINRRLIETITDSQNVWLNGLTARGFILGGRVEFQEDENVITDMMDGIIKLHVYVTPPSPARQIDFILEYDPDYLSTLFS